MQKKKLKVASGFFGNHADLDGAGYFELGSLLRERK